MDIAERLRDELKNCGETRYRISKRTGIAAPVLSRFVSGQRTITAETAGKLCSYFGLELVKVKSKRQVRRGKHH